MLHTLTTRRPFSNHFGYIRTPYTVTIHYRYCDDRATITRASVQGEGSQIACQVSDYLFKSMARYYDTELRQQAEQHIEQTRNMETANL